MLRKFLLFCSGAKLSILYRKDCIIEQNKYEMIGLTILFTAILASLSGGYALFMVFQSLPISSAFGVFWGSIILNLDRFIVANIKKGKGNLLEQLIVSFPRLVLAVFLAIVITKPLELKLFQKEIEARIIRKNEEQLVEARKKLTQDIAVSPQMNRLQEERRQLSYEIKEIEGKIAFWLTRIPPNNAEASRLETLGEQKEVLLKSVNQRIVEIDNRIRDSIIRVENAQESSGSLLTQIAVMEELSAEDDIIRNISLFITLIFIVLETSPIVVKVLSRYGPYDAILENEEETVIYQQTKKIIEVKTAIDQEFSNYRDIHKQDLESYRNMRKSMREFDKDKGTDSYRNMRTKFNSFINEQFLKSLEEVLKDQRFYDIRYKVIQEIIDQTEEELMKYSKGIQIASRSVVETLEKVRMQILEERLSSKFDRSVTEVSFESLADELMNMNKHIEDLKNNSIEDEGEDEEKTDDLDQTG